MSPVRRTCSGTLVVRPGRSLGVVLVPAPEAQADTYAPISGAGSTWSQVAVDAWRADIRASGVVVNFAGTGSTDGRSQFIQGTVDFANTEIPFQNPPEPGQQAETPSRAYAYLPIVAGGTSFMYNLTVGGQRVRDLRLSAPTLAKIFTGAITRWSDPAIAADYGKALPDIPIIPVVRSDGAGASAQFTKYMASQAPTIYCPFIQDKLHLSAAAARASPSTRRSAAPRRRSAPTVSPTTSPRRTARARSATSSTPTPSGSTSRSSGCSTRPATTRSRPPATSRSR